MFEFHQCANPQGCWDTDLASRSPLPKEFWDNPRLYCQVMEEIVATHGAEAARNDIVVPFDHGDLVCHTGQDPRVTSRWPQ